MQHDAPDMTELQPVQDSKKPQRFLARIVRKKMPSLTLSQLFPAAADSYTTFRPIGLVTPNVALHHFLYESDAYRQWCRIGWRSAGSVSAVYVVLRVE